MKKQSADLRIAVKRKWFEQIKAGLKHEELRLVTPHWKKRLQGRQYDRVIITLGYPKKDDMERTIIFPWNGYIIKHMQHEEFGSEPVLLFAIRLQEEKLWP